MNYEYPENVSIDEQRRAFAIQHSDMAMRTPEGVEKFEKLKV